MYRREICERPMGRRLRHLLAICLASWVLFVWLDRPGLASKETLATRIRLRKNAAVQFGRELQHGGLGYLQARGEIGLFFGAPHGQLIAGISAVRPAIYERYTTVWPTEGHAIGGLFHHHPALNIGGLICQIGDFDQLPILHLVDHPQYLTWEGQMKLAMANGEELPDFSGEVIDVPNDAAAAWNLAMELSNLNTQQLELMGIEKTDHPHDPHRAGHWLFQTAARIAFGQWPKY